MQDGSSESEKYDKIVHINETEAAFKNYFRKVLKLQALEVKLVDSKNNPYTHEFKYDIIDFTDS